MCALRLWKDGPLVAVIFVGLLSSWLIILSQIPGWRIGEYSRGVFGLFNNTDTLTFCFLYIFRYDKYTFDRSNLAQCLNFEAGCGRIRWKPARSGQFTTGAQRSTASWASSNRALKIWTQYQDFHSKALSLYTLKAGSSFSTCFSLRLLSSLPVFLFALINFLKNYFHTTFKPTFSTNA